ncbi:MAG: tetratricopeptide repeat protein [Xanthomonadales bacterium]|nr:tetratricopeptide repeat protein [Gammaproteobacteria bacterium]NNK50971.1 tetratricopeptide repeat protein [Xanthomonadales bacterium]
MFWTIAAAVLFAAALITFSPLLRARSMWKPLSLAMVFLVPAATLWMYQQFGTPEALKHTPQPPQQAAANQGHSPDSAEMDGMITSLRARLDQNPDSLEGWMLLSRTFKATQRFPEALEALENAIRIAPDNPAVMVEWVETQIFMTADGRITPEMTATLERALALQPSLQKALWLMGISASQAGDDARAIGYWETLLEQVEPGSAVAQSVQSQIDLARSRAGMAAPVAAVAGDSNVTDAPATGNEAPNPAAATVAMAGAEMANDAASQDGGASQGIKLMVGADAASQSQVPTGGVLYIMVRSPGPAMGPPLGVRRIINPQLPVTVTINDQDSMMQDRLISTETEVQVQARISLTGSPGAKPGDWQSAVQLVALDSAETVELLINQKVE